MQAKAGSRMAEPMDVKHKEITPTRGQLRDKRRTKGGRGQLRDADEGIVGNGSSPMVKTGGGSHAAAL